MNYFEASSSAILVDSRDSTSSITLMDPYISSPRQPPYIESSSQRRARRKFLDSEKEKDTSRIASWVQSQVENSALMISLTQMAAGSRGSSRDRSRSRKHRKHHYEPRILVEGEDDLEFDLADNFLSAPHITPIPLSQPKRYPTQHISSSYTTPITTKSQSTRRRRRSRWTNPNLDTIPELDE